MITCHSIESYVDSQPSIVKECFSSLISNPSEATRSAALRYLDSMKKFLARADVGMPPTSNWVSWAKSNFSVEDLMSILKSETQKEVGTLKHTVGKLFYPIAKRMMAYTLDFDLSQTTYEQESLVCDAIILAGLYLYRGDRP